LFWVTPPKIQPTTRYSSRRYFLGRWVKRASLGEVLDGSGSPWLYHDCSTTQGSSGSPLFDLVSGRVVAIHRSGFFMYRNEAVDADSLRQFIHTVTP
jgi:V8-like Glu-specific endopeptidase